MIRHRALNARCPAPRAPAAPSWCAERDARPAALVHEAPVGSCMSSGFQLAMLAPSSFAIISPATCRSLEPAGRARSRLALLERGLDVARGRTTRAARLPGAVVRTYAQYGHQCGGCAGVASCRS